MSDDNPDYRAMYPRYSPSRPSRPSKPKEVATRKVKDGFSFRRLTAEEAAEERRTSVQPPRRRRYPDFDD